MKWVGLKIAKAVSMLALILGFTSTAFAQDIPLMQENWLRYKVNGTDIPGLKHSISIRGPDGFWAFTEWRLRATELCFVTVTVNYYIPEIRDRSAVPADVLVKWDRMIENLVAHEKKHGQNGFEAAKEVMANKCENTVEITKRWAEKDRLLDQKTRHGVLDGVVLE